LNVSARAFKPTATQNRDDAHEIDVPEKAGSVSIDADHVDTAAAAGPDSTSASATTARPRGAHAEWRLLFTELPDRKRAWRLPTRVCDADRSCSRRIHRRGGVEPEEVRAYA
jgi:hypothetical protein